MTFLFILVGTSVLVGLAAPSIRRTPVLWYGVALALDFVYAYGMIVGLPPGVLQLLTPLVQRGMLATSLFVVVMYCGVFPEHSAPRRLIAPIRTELSLMACLLAAAHCLNYLSSYVGVLLMRANVLSGNQLASLIIALALAVLLVVLGVTSIRAVKRRMRAASWKNLQRLAYGFFGLIYVHEVLILYPAAFKGSGDAAATLAVSTVVFGAYGVLRIVRYLKDRHGRPVRSAEVEFEEEVGYGCTG